MKGTPHILICDDDHLLQDTLGVYLKNEGFSVSSAFTGTQALEKAESDHPDLIILDLMMPEKDGIAVCKEIRAKSNVPIIIFTAKDEEIDKIVGLELGADDYIVKTASNREVVARIKAVLRRLNEQPTAGTSGIIRYKNLEINIGNYDVKVAGTSIRFTPKEVEILYLLANSPGRVFHREEILSHVWGDYYGDERAVDTQIKRIRQKLPEGIEDWKITTVYSVGYKFDIAEQSKHV